MKENTKEKKKLIRLATKSLYNDLVHDTLMKFVEKAHDKIRQQWLRLEAIKIKLHDIRLNERCKRYFAIWKWATKRKREKRAIENFSKVLANRNDGMFFIKMRLKSKYFCRCNSWNFKYYKACIWFTVYKERFEKIRRN